MDPAHRILVPALLWLFVEIQGNRAFRTLHGLVHDLECLVDLPKAFGEDGRALLVLFFREHDRTWRPAISIRVDDEVPLMSGQFISLALPAEFRTDADLVPHAVIMLVRDDKLESFGEAHRYVLTLAFNVTKVHLLFSCPPLTSLTIGHYLLLFIDSWIHLINF